MKEIAQRISSCPDIVYNLLRHINSGAYHFKHTITNITQMTTLLGHQKLLSWLGLFIYGSPNQQPFGEAVYNSGNFSNQTLLSGDGTQSFFGRKPLFGGCLF
jgi:EAL and modified HD-GYP domain-containing signal transduction protein